MNKEWLEEDWGAWQHYERTLAWKLIDEISPEVFLDADISVAQALRLGAVLIKLSQDSFLEQTNKSLDLLKSDDLKPVVPKPTAAGVNLAQITINELFKQIDDARTH